jgi:glycosyltransferase involved in cell wall biosynthesis
MSVGVVVLSYNRPRLLRQSLASIVGADQIVIADDGSDFDPAEVAADLGIEVEVVRNPRVEISERMTKPRVGRLVNRAIERIEQDFVTYLCDDDLFAAGWIEDIERTFAENPHIHICRGEWWKLGTTTSAFVRPDDWLLTTGNFAHRTACVHTENCWWNEYTIAVHDAVFLTMFLATHQMAQRGQDVVSTGRLAGFRREHPFNLVNWVNRYDFAPEAEIMLRSGWLEPTEDEVPA